MTEHITVPRELLRQVLDAHRAMHEWIKAVPEPLISMPGVDGDWLDDVEGELRAALEQPAVEPIPQAVQTLIAAMQADPDYAWSWHCNIAMAYVDAGGDHYTGNQGAARLMKLLANVDPAHELPAPVQEPVADLDAIEKEIAETCMNTPPGWRCTRKAGHDGPCAAVHCPEDIEWVQRGMERLRKDAAMEAKT